MKIWSLSRNFELYSSARLVEAARQRGHEITELDTAHLTALNTAEGPRLLLHGEELPPADCAVYRSGYTRLRFGWDLALWRQVESLGIVTINSTAAVLRCSDKFYTHQLLTAAGIPTVDSVLVTELSQLNTAARLVGGFPLVLKWSRGTRGVGTALIESSSALRGQWQMSAALEQNALLERFHPEAEGSDLRAVVVGGKLIAIYRRTAPAGDFRSNIHRGGGAELYSPSEAEVELVEGTARSLDLELCGVDLLPTSEGSKVLEVNSVPGFRGVERVTNVDVAGAVIRQLERLVEGRK